MEEQHELGVDPCLPKPLTGHQLPLPSLDGTYHLGKHLTKISWNLPEIEGFHFKLALGKHN